MLAILYSYTRATAIPPVEEEDYKPSLVNFSTKGGEIWGGIDHIPTNNSSQEEAKKRQLVTSSSQEVVTQEQEGSQEEEDQEYTQT